jgi:Na+-transporting methylmalonyl-CoA/oxaloacetate decarboxylase beta subunit
MVDTTALTVQTGFLRNFPKSVMARVLAANTNESITPPTGAKYVIFSGNVDFFVKAGGTAAVPAADVTDNSGSELNPAGYWLIGADGAAVTSIGIISASAGIVTAAFYH